MKIDKMSVMMKLVLLMRDEIIVYDFRVLLIERFRYLLMS